MKLEKVFRMIGQEVPILITGISGRFPKAKNMAEFQYNLTQGIDMISVQSRWKHQNIPKRMGIVEDWDKFDSSFFNITPKFADMMDPQGRKLLEVTYEAIIDAGLSPDELRGSRTGVFLGAYGGDVADYHAINGIMDSSKKYHMLTKGGFMLANRISHVFDLQGPSLKVDTACSSSFVALEQAVSAIGSGKCDAAIVAASVAYFNPEIIENLVEFGALSPEGLSQVFDSKANGFVRSEAVVAIVIQKESEARRNYATIKHVQSSSNGWNSEGIAQTSAKCQEKLMRSVYDNAGLDIADVSYVEAHGTGTPAGDPTEVEALYNVFCSGIKRDRPLVIGSVKSNVGHCEPASGLVAIAKVLTAIQTGTIPANLNFQEPHPLIKPYLGKSLKVADRPIEWMGGLVGLSAYGIGGTNAHVVLEPGPIKPTANPRKLDQLPLLLPYSGRTREATENALKEASTMATEDPDIASVLQMAYSGRISEQNYRGYTIAASSNVNVSPHVSDRRPPLWFIFPGLGSQWEGMAKEMMKFPPFAESIMECERILKPVGIDLHQLVLASKCPSLFTNIRHAFVSVITMQVALYDLLMAIGLKPDGYIGHSSGESLCAYADGCFTREETILTGDAVGRAFLETPMVSGSMASIELSWNEATKRCPADVLLAGNNSPTNVTVAGPKEVLSKFVDQLRSEGIFAKEVNSCNLASHSKYVAQGGQVFIKHMKEFYPQRRLRSAKWISTAIPEEDWTGELGRYSSSEYFGNNCQQPVLFYEALQHIPDKAMVLEISPTGFFQGFLKDTLSSCTHVPIMTSSPTKDKVDFSLNRIGDLYNAGFEINIKNLYPELKLPVAANTPCTSPLVTWNHDKTWNTSFVSFPKRPGKLFEFDVADESDAYLNGQKIGGKAIYPAGGYLFLAWNALADMFGQEMLNFPIRMENVSFESATVLQAGSRAMLKFSVLDQTGAFAIADGDRVVVRGNIKATVESSTVFQNNVNNNIPEVSSEGVPNFLDKAEAYKELRLRGYNYSGYFQGINRISIDGTHAELEWMENWMGFLDTMLQSAIFASPRGRTAVPTRIDSVTIYPQQFQQFVTSQGVKVPTAVNQYLQSVTCPGIEIKGLKTTVLASTAEPSGHKVFKKHVFTPYWSNVATSNTEVVAQIFDIVMQQRNTFDINVVELCPDAAESIAGLYLEGVDFEKTMLAQTTLITLSKSLDQAEIRERLSPLGIRIFEKESVLDIQPPPEPVDLIFFSTSMEFGKLAHLIHEGTYVAVATQSNALEKPNGFKSLASFEGLDKRYFLLQKVTTKSENQVDRPDGMHSTLDDIPRKLEITQVSITSDNFSWLPELQAQLCKESNKNRRIYLTSQNDHSSGLVAFVKCVRKEAGGEVIRGILDPDGTLELDFQNPGPLLAQIIDDDLSLNVIRDGKLGTYCHISLEQEVQDDTPTKPCRHAVVDVMKPGDMSSLRWLEAPYNHFVPSVLPERKVLCRSSHVAINFRDVMQATGKIPYNQEVPLCESVLGFEYAGIGPRGRRMMGIVPCQGLATTVLAQEDMSFPIPDNWSFEEAATVPLAYMTAFYALTYRGRLTSGQSVLIHSGTGGVGQAAIRIALSIGCDVFTTVGSEEKRKFIKELFPQFKDENIGNSRDCSFEAMVMTQTKGIGVDAVLNSLAEDKFYASIRCLAKHGKFLEIGSYDFFQDAPIGSSVFLKNIEFHGIRVDDLADGCLEVKAFWAEQFRIGIQNGTVVPLQRTVFQADEIEKAFRFMATGTHTGKIIVNLGTDQEVMAVPRTFFSSDKAYIVVGGLGGLGLETSSWMVDRGVRHLIIPSRSGVTTGYQALCLRRWAKLGCRVETPKVDLSNFEKAEELITSIVDKKQLGGIINSAMVIRDGLIQDLTIEDFKIVAASKVPLTKNLDTLTRKYCPNLDYFVCYSSVVSGVGHDHQSNYGLSNSAMERICENRRRDGLHGLAIQWGVIGDVGFFEYKFHKSANYSESYKGLQPQKIPSCLEFLDRALQSKGSIITSFIFADRLKEVETNKTSLMVKIMNMFGLPDVHKLDGSTKLADLGMDSLIAAELAKILENDFDLSVSAGQLSLATIGDMRNVENGDPVMFTKDKVA